MTHFSITFNDIKKKSYLGDAMMHYILLVFVPVAFWHVNVNKLVHGLIDCRDSGAG